VVAQTVDGKALSVVGEQEGGRKVDRLLEMVGSDIDEAWESADFTVLGLVGGVIVELLPLRVT
jgi:hypothetical protein